MNHETKKSRTRRKDRIAEQGGLSRSEMLRHLLLASDEQPPAIRCDRQLWTIHAQLQQIVAESQHCPFTACPPPAWPALRLLQGNSTPHIVG